MPAAVYGNRPQTQALYESYAGLSAVCKVFLRYYRGNDAACRILAGSLLTLLTFYLPYNLRVNLSDRTENKPCNLRTSKPQICRSVYANFEGAFARVCCLPACQPELCRNSGPHRQRD